MLVIWGLRVIYRTLGQGVFFCRRCGGDRQYRLRAGRRFITGGPLTGQQRAAAAHLAAALGMTKAQAIGVITLTGQNAGQN